MSLNELNPDMILERIEAQRNAIGLSRNDVAMQAGMLVSTFQSNFKKHKIPMFADLYRISAALGIPVEHILWGTSVKPVMDPDNIAYWIHKSGDNRSTDCLLLRCPDKLALCKLLQVLTARIPVDAYPELGDDENPTDQSRYHIALGFLALEEADAIHLYDIITSILAKHYCSTWTLRPLKDVVSSVNELLCCLWDYKYLPVKLLWKDVEKTNRSSGRTKSQFLSETGINSKTYADYSNALGSCSSPSTETVNKICAYLNISDLDSRIRSLLPDIPDTISHADISRTTNNLSPRDSVLKGCLRSLPYLAQFFSAIFDLGFTSLKEIDHAITDAYFTPYSGMKYGNDDRQQQTTVFTDIVSDSNVDYMFMKQNPILAADYGDNLSNVIA